MATLFNTKISQTYEGLIKTIDNSAISTSLKELTDGSGNQLGLFVNSQGNFRATNIAEFGGLELSGVVINKIVTSADGIENFNNDTSLPTSAAVKTYVDNIVTIQDLDFGGNSGGGSVDLDSEIFMLIGTNGIVTSASGSNALAISGLALETSIDINTSNIVVNAQNIATNTSNIALNISDIATNVANISINATNIATNTTDIATNTTNIATNVANISTNAQDIASTESSLAIEIVDRQNADITLQANIDTETASRIAADNTLTTNLANEVSNRQSADTILQGNIDAEETARISADNTLQANINAEATTRANEDTTLQANINTEAGLRSSADTLLQSNIDAEALTRQGADITLQNNIDTEESARISADTTLQTNITSEQNSRIAADTTLQNQITLNDTDITNLQNDKQNISEKGQASGYVPLDANAKIQETYLPASVLGGLSYQGLWNASTNTPTLPNPTTVKGHYYVVDVAGTYQGQVYNVKDWVISDGVQWGHVDNTESVSSVFGRLGNVVANQSDYSSFYPLISDLNNEITNRTNADTTLQNNINTEASTRATNDTTLQTNIDNEETARINADTTLQTNISNEASTRASADTTLQGNIDAEETARISADTTLQNNINAITLASLGFTGDTNANYITNNNQLTNGAGYLTITSAASTYLPLSAGSGKPLSGDLYITKANTPLVQLLDTTNNKTLLIGVDNSNAFIRSGAGQKLLFQVNGSTPTAALTLLNNGYVGIGTDNPSMKMHINGDTSAMTQVGISNTSTGGARIYFDASNGDFSGNDYFSIGQQNDLNGVIDLAPAADLIIRTNGSERMRIDSNGNVGIGTDSPNAKLEVDLGADGIIGQFVGASSDTLNITGQNNEILLDTRNASNGLAFGIQGATKMVLKNSGNVGIGTDNPVEELHINDSTGNSVIRFSGGAGNNETYNIGQGIFAVSNGGFGFRNITENKYVMVFQDTTGNVGIGTTNPSVDLEVDGVVKYKTQRSTSHSLGDKAFIGISSGQGAQKFLIYRNTSVADGYANFKIHRAYDYGNNDQMVQDAIYQRRGGTNNFVFKYEGDISTQDDVYLEVYELSVNGQVEIWLCVDDYSQSVVEVISNPGTSEIFTSPSAGTPTGTLMHSSNPDTETPNWNSYQGDGKFSGDVEVAGDLTVTGDINGTVAVDSLMHTFPIKSGETMVANKSVMLNNNGDIFNIVQTGTILANPQIGALTTYSTLTRPSSSRTNKLLKFVDNNKNFIFINDGGNTNYIQGGKADSLGNFTFIGSAINISNARYNHFDIDQTTFGQSVIKGCRSYALSSGSDLYAQAFEYNVSTQTFQFGTQVVILSGGGSFRSSGLCTNIGSGLYAIVSCNGSRAFTISVSNLAVTTNSTMLTIPSNSQYGAITKISNSKIIFNVKNSQGFYQATILNISNGIISLGNSVTSSFTNRDLSATNYEITSDNKYYIFLHPNSSSEKHFVSETTYDPVNDIVIFGNRLEIPDDYPLIDIHYYAPTKKVLISGYKGIFGYTSIIDFTSNSVITYSYNFNGTSFLQCAISPQGDIVYNGRSSSPNEGKVFYGTMGNISTNLDANLLIGVNNNNTGTVKISGSVITDASLNLTANNTVYLNTDGSITTTFVYGTGQAEVGYAISTTSYILKIRQ